MNIGQGLPWQLIVLRHALVDWSPRGRRRGQEWRNGMRPTKRERRINGLSQRHGIDRPHTRQERDVGEILDARVRTLARHRIGVKLLGDVSVTWVEPELRWLDP